MTKKIVLALIMILPLSSFASLSSEMTDFFRNSGVANYTSPGFVRSQQAGHLTGGAAQIKTRSMNFQPGRIQLPSINAGCGGINWYTGGLSFIGVGEFVEFSKAVMTVGPAYAFDLAFQTLQPNLKSSMDKLRDFVRQINSMNVSSCEAAQFGINAVAGAFGNQEAQKFTCQMIGTSKPNNTFTDWLSAKNECSKQAVSDEQSQKAQAEGKSLSEILPNSNLVWMLLKKFKGGIDPESAEVIISMVGTEIYGASFKDKQSILPIVGDSDKDLISTLLYGGETSIWKCDTTSGITGTCMNMSKKDITIDAADSMIQKVKEKLEGIYQKDVKSEALTKEEEIFLSTSDLPLLQMMSINGDADAIPQIDILAEVVATTYLKAYLSELIDTLRFATASKRVSGSPEIKEILNNAIKAERIVGALPEKARAKLLSRQSIIRSFTDQARDAKTQSVGDLRY